MILEIKGDGPLALLPIQEGEVITAVGNTPVVDIKNFEDQFKKEIRKNTNSILLTIFLASLTAISDLPEPVGPAIRIIFCIGKNYLIFTPINLL